jgi:hypothetical protein
MDGNKKKNLDPLFQLFEHYLLNRSYDDSGAFTKEVAEEYLAYLDSTLAHVPFHSRSNVLEDLETEARELLVKKMYGCVRASDYANFGKVMRVKKGVELASFDFEPPILSEESKKG